MVHDLYIRSSTRVYHRAPWDKPRRHLGAVLLPHIKNLARHQKAPISLKHLANEPLYNATNLVLLGSAFSTDTYRGFQTLNKSVPYCFSRTLMWFWPSYAARMRIVELAQGLFAASEVVECDDRLSRGFMKQGQKHTPLRRCPVGAKLPVGVHSNTLSNSFFLVSFPLGDSNTFTQVRAKIDSAVEKCGSLEALLEAGPGELHDPSSQLLTGCLRFS